LKARYWALIAAKKCMRCITKTAVCHHEYWRF